MKTPAIETLYENIQKNSTLNEKASFIIEHNKLSYFNKPLLREAVKTVLELSESEEQKLEKLNQLANLNNTCTTEEEYVNQINEFLGSLWQGAKNIARGVGQRVQQSNTNKEIKVAKLLNTLGNIARNLQAGAAAINNPELYNMLEQAHADGKLAPYIKRARPDGTVTPESKEISQVKQGVEEFKHAVAAGGNWEKFLALLEKYEQEGGVTTPTP